MIAFPAFVISRVKLENFDYRYTALFRACLFEEYFRDFAGDAERMQAWLPAR